MKLSDEIRDLADEIYETLYGDPKTADLAEETMKLLDEAAEKLEKQGL